jgi:hypothetical protein
MADHVAGLQLIPEHMRESVKRWIETGFPHPRMMGSFLRAVLANDLMGAFANADEDNARALRGWAMYLYNHAPSGCYGSAEHIAAWHTSGGLLGQGRVVTGA